MRRSEKEIGDRKDIDAVIRNCRVCRLGLCDAGQPYVVPMCFGYDGRSIFMHCATAGRKLDILTRNNRVCVEFDVLHGFREADAACAWSIRYESVIAAGTAHVVVDMAAKRAGLARIMSQYSERDYTFPDGALSRTAVIRVDLDEIAGKQAL